MKKLSLYNLGRQFNNTLSFSWNYYLYLNKYPVVCYITYDGAESDLVFSMKLQLLKNQNKLLIINKKQIRPFYFNSNANIFKFLQTGRYMMLFFNTWDELNFCLNTELGIKLVTRYQFITISYYCQFLNLFWYNEPLMWIKNFSNNINTNQLDLIYFLYLSFVCFIYCSLYYVLLGLFITAKTLNSISQYYND